MLRRFSHRCRNSLSAIKLGLYLLKKEGGETEGPLPSRWNSLWRTYDEIEKLLDTLQRIHQSTSLTVVRSPLGRLFDERLPFWRARFGEWGRTIVLDPPEHDVPGDFDPAHLGRGLDAFVAWRSEAGESHQPRLAWRAVTGQFEISWDEAPRGCSHVSDERPDKRAPDAQSTDWTNSLPLLLLARIAIDHGGEVEARPDKPLSITARWPQFATK